MIPIDLNVHSTRSKRRSNEPLCQRLSRVMLFCMTHRDALVQGSFKYKLKKKKKKHKREKTLNLRSKRA